MVIPPYFPGCGMCIIVCICAFYYKLCARVLRICTKITQLKSIDTFFLSVKKVISQAMQCNVKLYSHNHFKKSDMYDVVVFDYVYMHFCDRKIFAWV